MTLRKVTILAVDDDARILRMIQRILELEGYRVIKAINGEDALAAFDEGTPDLVLLDIMMPGMDGSAVCERIREFSQVPIIMVTAKGDETEKVRCLDAGADDYVTKPFSSKEFAARIRVALRHTTLWDERSDPKLVFKDMEIDFARHKVTLNGRELDLTATEHRLLSYLARNAGRILTPDQILGQVWGENYTGETHLLQVNIARLRRKIKDDVKKPVYIVTRPGIGYMMPEEAPVEVSKVQVKNREAGLD
ncbi:MAG: response regulator transcription factor [Dehalococcoidia bacterium]